MWEEKKLNWKSKSHRFRQWFLQNSPFSWPIFEFFRIFQFSWIFEVPEGSRPSKIMIFNVLKVWESFPNDSGLIQKFSKFSWKFWFLIKIFIKNSKIEKSNDFRIDFWKCHSTQNQKIQLECILRISFWPLVFAEGKIYWI